MQWEMTSIILGIVVVFLSIFAVSTYLGTHINNGLCENRFTKITESYVDHGEGIDYPAWMTDCCYDIDRAGDVCEKNKEALRAEGEKVDDNMCAPENLGKDNPATLFSCVESTKLCNNETCVQSCNNDNICQRNLGEGYWCGDCQ